jgi:predicted transcriptional regulator
MADASQTEDLIALTADIVSAHVANNSVHTGEIAALIASVHKALVSLEAPVEPAAPEKPKGAVSVRASIKPDFLVSMIDGKPYKMLKRHIGQHGHTPQSYREAYDLPKDYPMVAANYGEQRRQLAHKIGLGRKPKAIAPAPRSRKPKAAPTDEPTA